MGWLSGLFGPTINPDSVPAGPVAAVPSSLASFVRPARVVARLWYSPDPRHAEDLPAVHRALHRALDDASFLARARAEAGPREAFHLEVPTRLSGPVSVWVRDVAVPTREFPADLLVSGQMAPFWLRFDSPRAVRLDIAPEHTPGGRARQRIARVRTRGGVAVRAALVQANAALFEPGPEDLPCLVVFGFDDRVGDEELEAAAARVGALKNTEPTDPDLALVAGLTTDERFVYYGRTRLPRRVAGKRELFVAHLEVHRPFLPRRYLAERVLDCIAEPRESGMLELLPHNPNT